MTTILPRERRQSSPPQLVSSRPPGIRPRVCPKSTVSDQFGYILPSSHGQISGKRLKCERGSRSSRASPSSRLGWRPRPPRPRGSRLDEPAPGIVHGHVVGHADGRGAAENEAAGGSQPGRPPMSSLHQPSISSAGALTDKETRGVALTGAPDYCVSRPGVRITSQGPSTGTARCHPLRASTGRAPSCRCRTDARRSARPAAALFSASTRAWR